MRFDYYDFNQTAIENLENKSLADSRQAGLMLQYFDEINIVEGEEVYTGSVDIIHVYKYSSISSAWLNWIKDIQYFRVVVLPHLNSNKYLLIVPDT